MSEQKLYIVSTSTSVVCPHSLIVIKLLVVGLNKLLTLYLENIDVSASLPILPTLLFVVIP